MSNKGISTTAATLAGAYRIFKSGITPETLRQRYSDPNITERIRLDELAAQMTLINPMVEQMCQNGAKPQEFTKVVTYAYVLMEASRHPMDIKKAYEFLDDDYSCEGMVDLKAVNGEEFEDDGHAITWAMQ